jgi:hypothetical protein
MSSPGESKVKLCLTKYHTTKTYGGVEVWLHVFLTSALYGSECGQLHAPAVNLRGRAPGIQMIGEWVPLEPVWMRWRRENFPALSEIETR